MREYMHTHGARPSPSSAHAAHACRRSHAKGQHGRFCWQPRSNCKQPRFAGAGLMASEARPDRESTPALEWLRRDGGSGGRASAPGRVRALPDEARGRRPPASGPAAVAHPPAEQACRCRVRNTSQPGAHCSGAQPVWCHSLQGAPLSAHPGAQIRPLHGWAASAARRRPGPRGRSYQPGGSMQCTRARPARLRRAGAPQHGALQGPRRRRAARAPQPRGGRACAPLPPHASRLGAAALCRSG